MLVSTHRAHNRKYFYKYTSASTAIRILTNRTLRLSSPLLFNDPFDIPRVLKLAFTSEELNQGIIKELFRLANDQAYSIGTNLNPKLRIFLEWARSIGKQQLHELENSAIDKLKPVIIEASQPFIDLQKQWVDMLPNTRILCITEENNNPVMWSSYSDCYRGVVLELECLDIYDSILLLSRPVNYTDDFPTIGKLDYWIRKMTGQVEYDYKQMFADLEATKKLKWQYEKEWRVISYDKQGNALYSDYGMHPRTFSSIYLGKDISAENRQLLLKLIDYDLSHLQPYEMKISHETRSIDFSRIKST